MSVNSEPDLQFEIGLVKVLPPKEIGELETFFCRFAGLLGLRNWIEVGVANPLPAMRPFFPHA
jgi:hypothetical protein